MTTTEGRNAFRAFAVTLALLGLTTAAQARNSCARPREMTALKVAIVQQELMVAALTCHDTNSYNRFVTGYRGELQRSDAVLRRYFRHHGGMRAYHAYKTRLANASSLASLHDIKGYCAHARATFHDALDTDSNSLVTLVADRQADGVEACRSHRTRVAERP